MNTLPALPRCRGATALTESTVCPAARGASWTGQGCLPGQHCNVVRFSDMLPALLHCMAIH